MTIAHIQKVMMMANAILSEALGKASEIDSLTRRVTDLTDAVDFWNRWMIFGLVAAMAAAGWIVLTTRLVVIRGKELAIAQGQLDSAKDRQLQADLKEKDIEIGKLKIKADTAEGGIASAQAEAANANLLAEQEKLARVKIEKQLAPRLLSESDRKDIAGKMQKFASGFSGRKVKISSPVGDAEAVVFSLEIMDIFTRSGIDVDPVIGRVQQVGLVKLGTEITGPATDQEFMKALATEIRADCDTALHVEWGPQYSEVTVAVWTKPVAGLPTVVQPPVK